MSFAPDISRNAARFLPIPRTLRRGPWRERVASPGPGSSPDRRPYGPRTGLRLFGGAMSVISHESAIRLGFFAGVLALMAAWEVLAPRRRLTTARPVRWLSNLGLVALDTAAVRLLVPLGAVGMAVVAEGHGWGLFYN